MHSCPFCGQACHCGGDPCVRIEITPERSAYLFQTAICGYQLARFED